MHEAQKNSKSSIINSQSLCVSPEDFEIVIFAVLFVEDVDYDVDEIHEYPSALLVAGLAESVEAGFFGVHADFVYHRPPLPVARTGGDYEVVRRRAQAPQIQNRHIGAVSLNRDLCRGNGKFSAFIISLVCQVTLSTNKSHHELPGGTSKTGVAVCGHP